MFNSVVLGCLICKKKQFSTKQETVRVCLHHQRAQQDYDACLHITYCSMDLLLVSIFKIVKLNRLEKMPFVLSISSLFAIACTYV